MRKSNKIHPDYREVSEMTSVGSVIPLCVENPKDSTTLNTNKLNNQFYILESHDELM